MKGPARWRDDHGSPDDVRAMLSAAKKTRPMTGQDRARLGKRIGRAALAPTGIALGLWSKAVLAAVSLSAASWAAVATVRKVVRRDERAITAPSRGPAPRSTRSPSARTSLRAAPEAQITVTAPPLAMVPAASALPPSVAPAMAAPEVTHGPIPQPPLPRSPSILARHVDHGPSAAQRVRPALTVAIAASLPVSTDDAQRSSAAPGANALPPLLREAQLVERARAALARDPATALQRVTEADEAFPSGALRSERDVVAIDALVRLGLRERARARAQHALLRDPQSAYAARWRAALEDTEPR